MRRRKSRVPQAGSELESHELDDEIARDAIASEAGVLPSALRRFERARSEPPSHLFDPHDPRLRALARGEPAAHRVRRGS